MKEKRREEKRREEKRREEKRRVWRGVKEEREMSQITGKKREHTEHHTTPSSKIMRRISSSWPSVTHSSLQQSLADKTGMTLYTKWNGVEGPKREKEKQTE
jgi:hypothetical protein